MNKKRIINEYVLLLLPFLVLQVTAQKTILPPYHADPSAKAFAGKYWIYPSHDLAGSKDWSMVDWHVFSSTNLKKWKDEGVIFGLKDISWAKQFAWAPDAAYRNGKYYFYYPADFQIGVAVADNPKGPFNDPLGKPLIEKGEGNTLVIDPCIFIDEDSTAYLYFGQNKARSVKLKKDMITRDGPIMEVDVKNFHEGGWVHKRDSLYYFSYCAWEGDSVVAKAHPGAAREKVKYHGKIAYSVSKSPLGPWEYKGIIMDNGGRNNHHSIVKFGRRWYIFYHNMGPSFYERMVCVAPLNYDIDGAIKPVKLK